MKTQNEIELEKIDKELKSVNKLSKEIKLENILMMYKLERIDLTEALIRIKEANL